MNDKPIELRLTLSPDHALALAQHDISGLHCLIRCARKETAKPPYRLCPRQHQRPGADYPVTRPIAGIARTMQGKGAGIRSLAEPFLDSTSNFAELKLRHIKDRMARGREDANAKGVKFGREPKLTDPISRENHGRG